VLINHHPGQTGHHGNRAPNPRSTTVPPGGRCSATPASRERRPPVTTISSCDWSAYPSPPASPSSPYASRKLFQPLGVLANTAADVDALQRLLVAVVRRYSPASIADPALPGCCRTNRARSVRSICQQVMYFTFSATHTLGILMRFTEFSGFSWVTTV
jgi:hypothetical protein